jgi:hypothetical protein
VSRIIARIAGEGRWSLEGPSAEKIMEDDRLLSRAVDDEREVEYRYLLAALCRYVRTNGRHLSIGAGDADVTIPSPAMSLEEVVELLSERANLREESDEEA